MSQSGDDENDDGVSREMMRMTRTRVDSGDDNGHDDDVSRK